MSVPDVLTPAVPTTRVGRAAALTVRTFLVLAGLLMSGLLPEALVGFPLDVRSTYVSELMAADQPHGFLVRVIDGTGAALVLAALVVLVAAHGLPAHWFGWAVAGSLLVLAVATVGDDVARLDCGISRPACIALEEAGDVSFMHTIHGVTSTVAGFAAFALAVVVLVGRGRTWRAPAAWPVLVPAAVLLGTSGVVAAVGLLGGEPWGLVQRLQLLCVAMLVATSGRHLLEPEPPRAQPRDERP
ncbi:DUF998 domain-containing protein [Sanguibacter sp. HDW7]|uniref:DUF998 domain-containing protein n=1 Tax=Sanguibacter sp. HDW7 TaxID=2714931 RepID=UPI001408EE4F|nr:DUF998 domain-containing protein [Sanguibacter sp. HDW7]QIK84541.1 DUF998 domain-containing protein [Sanguibacter sp. HDW7]